MLVINERNEIGKGSFDLSNLEVAARLAPLYSQDKQSSQGTRDLDSLKSL